jgi:sulfatase maturation enzyme AslB (radical SAM superfamily)
LTLGFTRTACCSAKSFCELFAKHFVRVGISVDGDRAANDRHRRYADGRSSYGMVIRAIELLRNPVPAPLLGAAVHDRHRK